MSALAAAGAEMHTAERARRALEVEALATQRIDFAALLNFQELAVLPDTVAKGKFDPPLDTYQWETTSTPLADQAGVYDVRVHVLWDKNESYLPRIYLYRRPPTAGTTTPTR